MQALFLKEVRQYFSSLTGYLAIGLFLLLMGLLLFVFPDTSILDYGYATLDKFFELAPFVLLLLVPAVTMRSLSDEFKSGTWELLKTRPLSLNRITSAKFFASLVVVLLALLPTLIYVFTIRSLSINGLIDGGGIAGSYTGLFFLSALFTAIGVYASSLSANSIVSFLLAAFLCFVCFNAFSAVAAIPGIGNTTSYYISQLGISEHYYSLSSGQLKFADILYFLAAIACFLLLTNQNLETK